MTTTVITQHVYMWASAAKRLVREPGYTPDPDDYVVMSSDSQSCDSYVYVCPVEFEVHVPNSDKARLALLTGLEKEYAKELDSSKRRLAQLSERMEELRALPAPTEENAS
jgi:hypothetical protein